MTTQKTDELQPLDTVSMSAAKCLNTTFVAKKDVFDTGFWRDDWHTYMVLFERNTTTSAITNRFPPALQSWASQQHAEAKTPDAWLDRIECVHSDLTRQLALLRYVDISAGKGTVVSLPWRLVRFPTRHEVAVTTGAGRSISWNASSSCEEKKMVDLKLTLDKGTVCASSNLAAIDAWSIEWFDVADKKWRQLQNTLVDS